MSSSASIVNRRIALTLLASGVLLALLATTSSPAHAGLPAGFTTTQITAGPARPYQMAFAPDGRIFVSQQGGRLRVIKNGALLSTPFVTLPVDTAGDRGLIGVALDPNFELEPYVYVYYTATTPTIHNRVSRFRALGDVAVAGSEEILLELDPLATSTTHNGGSLHFGGDGKLYVTTGENAQQGGTVAQSMSSLLGKMLRINRDGSIPTDNPFYDSATGQYRAIWALGLRNPFTFAVQPGTGRTFINDVGAGVWEEINDGLRGANYGWPQTEGPTTDPRFTSPLYAYGHGWTDTTGCAISGGVFYNTATPRYPAGFLGDYLFADYCTGWIRRFDPADGSVTAFATEVNGPIDLDIGPDGNLYYLSRSNETGNPGAVYKVEYSGLPAIAEHPGDVTVAPGQSATFRVTASGEEPLSYQWQRDGVDIPGATSSTYTIRAGGADDGAQFRVVVSNGLGTVTSDSATLTVTTNVAPEPTILTPDDGTKYDAGDTIAFTGAATDEEDGTLPPSAFEWEVVFHHHEHTHPGPNLQPGPTGDGRSGSFTIPDEGETEADVWYRIRLTVTDSGGVSQTTYRDVTPNTSTITIRATPTSADDGLLVTIDGQLFHTPYTTESVVGMKRTIGAVSPQALGETSYVFDEWSDGGAETHEIVTPSTDVTYTAAFHAAGDMTPPETTVLLAPTITKDTTPDFTFSASELGASFECAVDGGPFAPCASPHTLPALANGQHLFAVRATDAAGNTDPTPASHAFTVDATGPSVAITSPAPDQVVAGTLDFAADASDNVGVTGVKWYVDEVEVASDYNGAPWTKAWNTSAVADGPHKVHAKARDAAGNWTTSAKFNFTVRNTVSSGLDTFIDSGPTLTKDTTPDFTFSSSDAAATFECAVNGAPFAPCTSPHTLPLQADGTHVFSVRARNAAGSTDPTPASQSFTVDATGPSVAVSSPTPNQVVAGMLNLAADASDGVGVTGVKWYVDDVEVASDYNGAPWTKPWDTTAVPDGAHKVHAKARDAAGNWTTSAKLNFTVRNTASSGLDTFIDSGPTVTSDSTPDFYFSATQAGSTFECKVDAGSFADCTSPMTLPTQVDGGHTFYVRATDSAGTMDPTPASQSFTVDTTNPVVSVTSPATGSVASGVVTLGASATDLSTITGVKWYVDGVEVARDYDGAPWATSWDSATVSDGVHMLSAKARDAAGNWGTSKKISVTVDN